MKVMLRQFEFDTDEMTRFETGVDTMPAIFVNSGGAAFLEIARAGWEQTKIRAITRSEAMRLAGCYGIVGLRERLIR